MQYILYSTDDSFDYNAPWGTDTYYEIGLHGFEYDEVEGLESLEGFGDFSYLEKYKNDVNELIKALDEILLKDYREDDPEASSSDKFEKLMEYLRELAMNKDAA